MGSHKQTLKTRDHGFESASVQIIKSIRQRDLFNKWLAVYSVSNVTPELANFYPDIPTDDRETIVDYSVTFDHGEPDIVIESFGTRMAAAYGATGQGQSLSDFVGEDLAPSILPPYYECVRRELPVYAITRVEDADKRPVDVERLMLPLCQNGHVAHIVVSFEVISQAGNFELRNLMRENPPKTLLWAVIDQNLVYDPPPRIPRKDRIVFD